MNPAVWVVVLNWNNGSDTVECLDSVLNAADPAIAGVVVCDNGSTDDSLQRISQWALRRGLAMPAYQWNDGGFHARDGGMDEQAIHAGPCFVLIQIGANLGFAGGNNVGMRFVQWRTRFDHVLLLNNDALLSPGAVSAMAGRMHQQPDAGMCGCTVIYDHSRQVIQAMSGARFRPWLARASHIGARASVDARRNAAEVERQLDYILGAAMMISARCLAEVGLMDERYFLYYEEIDWALRARRQGFTLAYAPDAEVFHKEGGTIGSSGKATHRSLLSEHYLVRSCRLFTSKFYPWFLPTVVIYSLLLSLRAMLRGDGRRAFTRVRALLGFDYRG